MKVEGEGVLCLGDVSREHPWVLEELLGGPPLLNIDDLRLGLGLRFTVTVTVTVKR